MTMKDLYPCDRYKILIGTTGYYIYDYKLYDVVKRNGEFFFSEKKSEADEFLLSLQKEQ